MAAGSGGNTGRSRRRLHVVLTIPQAVIGLGLLGATVMWSAAVTGYVVFHDDVIAEFAERHAAMQRDYQRRLASAAQELATARSAHVADRTALSAEVERLTSRQARLEMRQSAVAQIVGADDDVSPEIEAGPAQRLAPAKPSVLDGTVRLEVERAPERVSRALPASSRPTAHARATGMLGERLTAAAALLDQIEARQGHALATAEERLERERRLVREVYARVGIAPPAAAPQAQGGPYLAYAAADSSGDRQLTRIAHARADVDLMREGLERLPVRLPTEVASLTSRFGTRIDPFLGRPAFHSGVDFPAPSGTPVRATASGTVELAGPNGGYGLMVELAHAHGLLTRYAHLSVVAVKPGSRVSAGDIVGYVGTTGRSTGPHLHYETRRGDKALDPAPFLAAGRLLEADD